MQSVIEGRGGSRSNGAANFSFDYANHEDQRGTVQYQAGKMADRENIYRLRHEIYARELAQHEVQHHGNLRDPLDTFNTYVVAVWRGKIAGFISITPPGDGGFSIAGC